VRHGRKEKEMDKDRMVNLLNWFEDPFINDGTLSVYLFGKRPTTLTHEEWTEERVRTAREELLEAGLIEWCGGKVIGKLMTQTTQAGRALLSAPIIVVEGN
jgi:hypothetical protein